MLSPPGKSDGVELGHRLLPEPELLYAASAASAAVAISFLRGFYLHRDADGWLDLLFELCE
jgi:hypothetical protein